MSRLTEIQKAIEELSPEERKELRDWLDRYDSATERQWVAIAQEPTFLNLSEGGEGRPLEGRSSYRLDRGLSPAAGDSETRTPERQSASRPATPASFEKPPNVTHEGSVRGWLKNAPRARCPFQTSG